jgi:hypothetical protein
MMTWLYRTNDQLADVFLRHRTLLLISLKTIELSEDFQGLGCTSDNGVCLVARLSLR